MSLTFASAPLAERPADTNYRIDGPSHRLFFEPFGRRVRAVVAGEVVADSSRGRLLHETGILPVLYFPTEDVDTGRLQPSSTRTTCPFKGEASYWSLVAGGEPRRDAAWAYEQPLTDAAWLLGYLAFYWDAIDEWYDEEERVQGHLRDPYHRVDVRRSARRVRVRSSAGDDAVIADTDAVHVLAETGLPLRYYLDKADVRGHLRQTATTSICPYKGTATYWDVVLPDGQELHDAAWSYEQPLENALGVAGRVAFDPGVVTVEELVPAMAGRAGG